MAGHSKFKNIMHRKGAQDAKRSKQFAKFSKEIMVAAKMGGDDMSSNSRLRLAVATARASSMPKDNIERAIKKGAGGADGDNFTEMRYEGYATGGIAVIVEALTDNKNRTASDVRSTFSKHGGNLGETGSVGFMFDRVGEVVFETSVASADEMFEFALEVGASDVESDEDVHIITTEPADFGGVLEALSEKFGNTTEAGLKWRPQTPTALDLGKTESVLKMVEKLEDLDDVQAVHTNLDITDEIAEQLE